MENEKRFRFLGFRKPFMEPIDLFLSQLILRYLGIRSKDDEADAVDTGTLIYTFYLDFFGFLLAVLWEMVLLKLKKENIPSARAKSKLITS